MLAQKTLHHPSIQSVGQEPTREQNSFSFLLFLEKGTTPPGYFLTPTGSLDRRESTVSISSVESFSATGDRRGTVFRQGAVQEESISDSEEPVKRVTMRDTISPEGRQYLRRGSHCR